MTRKTHHTAVVFVPPEVCHEPIQAIRRRHDRHLHRWMPHITLLYPFLPKPQFDDAEKRLRKALKTIKPFHVNLERFDCFHHGRGRYTIWLAPEPCASMIELQAALQQAIPECDNVSRYEKGFTPHLSVGQVNGKKRLEKTLGSLQEAWTPISFMTDLIHFIWRGARTGDRFVIDRNILFDRQ